MKQTLKIVDCDEQYWDFVRLLRMDHRVTDGFVEKMETMEQQTVYMNKNSESYRIVLLNNEPADILKDDIRICVHPEYQRGIGQFLVKPLPLRFGHLHMQKSKPPTNPVKNYLNPAVMN